MKLLSIPLMLAGLLCTGAAQADEALAKAVTDAGYKVAGIE